MPFSIQSILNIHTKKKYVRTQSPAHLEHGQLDLIGNLSDKPQNDIKTEPTSMLSLAVSRLELVVLKLKDNKQMQYSEKYRTVKANYLTGRMVPWLLLVGRSPVYSNL